MEENFGPDFITVTDEEGNDFELELVDTLEHKGITYYAMFPAVEEDEATGEPRDVDADDEEYGLVIMRASRRTARSCCPPWTPMRSWTRSMSSLWSAFSQRKKRSDQFLLGA